MLVLTKLIAPYANSLSQEIVWMDDEPSFIVESMRNEDLLKLKYYSFLFFIYFIDITFILSILGETILLSYYKFHWINIDIIFIMYHSNEKNIL